MIRAALLCLLCMVAQIAPAASLQELLERDHLRLKTWLEPAESIVVGQEVRLVVEVATRRWFAGGTRIRHPEVTNLVILQRDNFATNLSRQESGQTWVVQQWRLELYPQAGGLFLIPPLTLELAVNDATAGIVRGQLQSAALDFSATIPQLMSAAQSWLAAPQFSVEQGFNRELESLSPGDAFTRTIKLQAGELNSMMLPTFRDNALPGLASYPANPKLQDRSNRGAATAIRTEVITYVVEQPGQYQLPAVNYYWWNTATQSAEIATLEAITVDAGVAVASSTKDQPAASLPSFPLRWLWLLAVPILLIAWYRIYRRRIDTDVLGAALQALKQGRRSQGLGMLYAWLNRAQPGPNWLSLRSTAQAWEDPSSQGAIEEIITGVYGKTSADDQSGPANINLNPSQTHREESWWARPATTRRVDYQPR